MSYKNDKQGAQGIPKSELVKSGQAVPTVQAIKASAVKCPPALMTQIQRLANEYFSNLHLNPKEAPLPLKTEDSVLLREWGVESEVIAVSGVFTGEDDDTSLAFQETHGFNNWDGPVKRFIGFTDYGLDDQIVGYTLLSSEFSGRSPFVEQSHIYPRIGVHPTMKAFFNSTDSWYHPCLWSRNPIHGLLGASLLMPSFHVVDGDATNEVFRLAQLQHELKQIRVWMGGWETIHPHIFLHQGRPQARPLFDAMTLIATELRQAGCEVLELQLFSDPESDEVEEWGACDNGFEPHREQVSRIQEFLVRHSPLVDSALYGLTD